MRLKAIKIGEFYAIGSPHSSYDSASRYRIVSIGKYRKDSWGSYESRRRVKAVRVYERNGAEHQGEPEVFDAQEVLMTWAQKVEEREHAEKLRQERADLERQARERRETSYHRIGEMLADISEDLVRAETAYLPVLDENSDIVYREPDYEGQTPEPVKERRETGKMIPGYGLSVNGLDSYSRNVNMSMEMFAKILKTLVDAGVPKKDLKDLLKNS